MRWIGADEAGAAEQTDRCGSHKASSLVSCASSLGMRPLKLLKPRNKEVSEARSVAISEGMVPVNPEESTLLQHARGQPAE